MGRNLISCGSGGESVKEHEHLNPQNKGSTARTFLRGLILTHGLIINFICRHTL